MKTTNPIVFNILLISLLHFASAQKILAQPKVIANVPIGTNSPLITNSDKLITIHRDFENDQNYLTETEITTGIQDKYTLPEAVDVYDGFFTSKGYFFFRGRSNSSTALVDTLCFLDFATKKMIRLGPINFRKNASSNTNNYESLGVFNDFFYCVGANKNNTFDFWRSDGSIDGTQKIWTSNFPYTQVGYVNGFFVFASYNGSTSSIISIADTGLISPTTLRTFDSKRFPIYFKDYGSNDGIFYFNVFDTLTKDYEFIATRGTIQTTESRFRYPTIYYNSNQSPVQKINAVFRDTIIIRSIQTGDILKKILVPDEIKEVNGGKLYSLGKGLFATESNKFGLEIGYLNRNDSFVCIDISKGPFSGISPNAFWRGQNDFTYINVAVSDSFYLVGFINNTNRKCLYKVILGNDSATVFKLANLAYLDARESEAKDPFVHNKKIYQIVFNWKLKTNLLYEIVTNNQIEIVENVFKDSTPTWHRQIGFGALVIEDPQYVLSDVSIDSKDNSILSLNVLNNNLITNYSNGKNFILKPFQQYDTRYSKNINTLNLTFKMSQMGNVVWTSSFGNSKWRVDNTMRQAIDVKDNIYVTGAAYQSAIFGSDTVKKQDAFLYLVKLDGNNGSIIYYKILAESRYTNDFDVDLIKVDADNNLFISFHYKNFQLPFASSVISNTAVSPANALAKFDESGNLLWLKNTLTPFTKYFGQTRDMCLDNENNRIYLLQSVGGFNWWSSCRNTDWDSYLQCLNLDGEVQWTKRIVSNDLHSLRSIILDKNGYINLSGYFRGTIQFDNVKLTSKRVDECNQFQYVTATLNPNRGETIMAMSFDNWVYLPHKNSVTGIEDKNVSIGFEPVSSSQHTLMAKEIDKWGGIIGYHKIEKLGSPFDFDFFPSIASKNNYVVVADVTVNSFDTFTNIMQRVFNISLARYHLKDFFTQSNYNFPIDTENSTGTLYNLVIYPNPVNNILNIFTNNLESNRSYTIYSIDGIKRMELKEETNLNISSFDISDLLNGFYFLQVKGNQGIETYKFIKK